MNSLKRNFARVVSQQLRNPTKSVTGWLVTNYFRSEKKFLANRAVKLLNIEPDHQVLEIGVGKGDGLLSAFTRIENGTGTIFGMERSTFMVQRARKRCTLEIDQNKIEIHSGFVTHLPFPSNFFDRVFHCNEYHYWKDKMACCVEIFRTMKPGGLMICTLKLERLKELEDRGYIPIGSFDPLTFMEVLDDSGFQDVHIKYHDENNFQAISAAKPLAADEEIDEEQLDEEELEFTRDYIIQQRLYQMQKLNEPLPPDKRLKEGDI